MDKKAFMSTMTRSTKAFINDPDTKEALTQTFVTTSLVYMYNEYKAFRKGALLVPATPQTVICTLASTFVLNYVANKVMRRFNLL